MGAAAVFETAADTPPMRKSMAKFLTPFFSAGALAKTGEDDTMLLPLKDIVGAYRFWVM
jgi:hypothetical protein